MFVGLVAAEMALQGYAGTQNTVHQMLKKFVFQKYKETFTRSEMEQLMEIPRIVIRGKRGAPRKDGTTNTIYIRAPENGAKDQPKIPAETWFDKQDDGTYIRTEDGWPDRPVVKRLAKRNAVRPA